MRWLQATEGQVPAISSFGELSPALLLAPPEWRAISSRMPPKRDAEGGGGGGAAKKSRLAQKTAAEFFAENKQFAGASLLSLFHSFTLGIALVLVRLQTVAWSGSEQPSLKD